MHHISLKNILGSILTMLQFLLYICCNCLFIYVHSIGTSLEVLSETYWIRKEISTEFISIYASLLQKKMTKKILCGFMYVFLHIYMIIEY